MRFQTQEPSPCHYTLNRANGLKAFLNDGRIEIDNNPAENAIRPNVLGRKNWLFSVSEAGAKANAICLSIAETAKANGVDFYRYLLKLLTDLPNLDIHQNPEILNQYLALLLKKAQFLFKNCAFNGIS